MEMVWETYYVWPGQLEIFIGKVSGLLGLEPVVFRTLILDRLSEENAGINYSGFRVVRGSVRGMIPNTVILCPEKTANFPDSLSESENWNNLVLGAR